MPMPRIDAPRMLVKPTLRAPSRMASVPRLIRGVGGIAVAR
jgi:hypothetical protein